MLFLVMIVGQSREQVLYVNSRQLEIPVNDLGRSLGSGSREGINT